MSLTRSIRWTHRAWRYRLGSNRAEVEFVRSQLSRGDLAVDLGVHKGGFLYWLRKAVGASGEVIGFEPQPRLADMMRSLLSGRGWTNVSIEQRAVADAPGSMQLGVPGDGDTSPGARLLTGEENQDVAWSTMPTEVVTLDAFLANRSQRVRCIKCDVEGGELAVFNGAQELLRVDGPALMFECEQRHQPDRPLQEVFDTLHALGYQGRFFSPEGLLPLEIFSVDQHQQLRDGDIADEKTYCNNFAFTRD